MAEQQPTRLMIKQMILENFKSYAGPQRVGPFHKNFSAVVGPNGSGKSNVIDALLFVFGRRAKQLRFNKVSELIHNSTHHRNLEMARVSVHFQEIVDKEGDDFEVVPGTEFVVARTAHRDNKSDYYVNDKKMSTKDVTAMLKGKGIDLDNNRFLILQGEVEQISLMKPKADEKCDTGFLEYLEDIIGTADYKPLIDTASKKLEEFTEKRTEMAQRVKAVEKDMQGLQGKKQAAESYINMSAEVQRMTAKACRLEIHRSQLHLEKLTEQVTAANKRLEEEVKSKEEQQKSLKDSEKKLKALEKEHARAQAAVEAAEKKFKDIEREDAKNVEQHKHLKEKIKKITKKIESDSKTLEKMKNESAAMEAEVPQQRQQAEETAVQLQEAEQHLEQLTASLQPEVQKLNKEASKVRSELAPWEAKMQEVQSRLDVAISERDVLVKKQADAQQRLVDAEKALKAALKSQQGQQQVISNLREKLEDSRVRLGDAQRRHGNCVANESRMDGVVKELRTSVEGMKQQLNAQKSQSQVMQSLMQAKQSGQLPGLYGRLGDLGAIDKKYDIAVSTAVGALDYVVVETAADAQIGVEILRSKNLGVATFLILEKQEHLAAKANENVQTPEGVPRLFDLVKMQDRRVALAFYFAMRDTVVADNLDQATRIAYGRDKRFSSVVTLQGELITQAGTMSGGGSRPRGGRMTVGNKAPSQTGSHQDARDLATSEQQLARATQELEAARAATVAADREIRDLERAVKALELDIPKAEMRARAEVSKANDLQKQVQNLQGSVEVDAEEVARISTLEKSITTANQEMGRLQASCQDLQKKLDAIMKKVENVGGSKLTSAKEAVKSLKQKLKQLEQDITNKTVKVDSNKKQVQKLLKEAQKNDAEKTKLEADLVALDERMRAAEEEAVQAMDDKEKCNEVFGEQDGVIKEARKKHEEQQESMGKMNKEIDDLKDEIKALQKQAKTEQQVESHRQAKIKEAEGKLRGLGVEVDEEMLSEEELQGTPEQLTGRINDFYYEVAMREEQLKAMDPDLTVLEQYRAKEVDLQAKTDELNTVTQERDEVRKEYEQLRKKRLDEFMAGFNIISLRLKEMYQMITLGGDAELELVDSLDPFSEGIEFSVRPPKKSWKCIANLSGGEKTLSSLSLVFALHHFKPTPLYVMDEIDAALDFRNVSIVGHYIKERTRNAQFVIISLRNNMFELADRMVGIYKTDNCTKSVCVNPGKFHLVQLPQPTRSDTSKGVEQQDKEQIPPVAVA